MIYSREQIMDKALELANMVAQTEEVNFYKKAEEKINEHEKVQDLISEIKKHQKEAVNLQHYRKHAALKKVEQKIDDLMAQVDEIPLVQEFKQSQVEVNDLLQLIATTISDTVTEKITKSQDDV